LYLDSHPKEFLLHTVEVYGEIRLIEKNQELTLENLVSSNHLINKLRELQMMFESELDLPKREPSGTNDKGMHEIVKRKLEEEIQYIKHNFEPIIHVYDIKRMPEAREIIAENLQYRLIQKRKSVLFKNVC
jgi:hypothetical protein